MNQTAVAVLRAAVKASLSATARLRVCSTMGLRMNGWIGRSLIFESDCAVGTTTQRAAVPPA